jgi:deoxyxylulose-5-phosphate synthase
VAVINARFAKPLDRRLILDEARGKKLVVTLEESVVPGGFGSAVLEAIVEAGLEDRGAQPCRCGASACPATDSSITAR